MKKALPILLILVLVLSCSYPVLAVEIVPHGINVTDGGMFYDLTYEQYYLYGYASGKNEYKTVTATLYTDSGSFVYAVTNSDTDYRVDAGGLIPFDLAPGRYKVQVVATTHNSTNSGGVRYYEID